MEATRFAWTGEVQETRTLERMARDLGCEVVCEPMPARLLGVCIAGPQWPVVFVSAACTAAEQQDYLRRMAARSFPPDIWFAETPST